MCQLLGMNANTPTDVMFSFTGLACRAEEHKDGFGIGFFEDKGVRLFVDHHSARQSPVAELVKGYPIHSENVIAHIRKATQGRVALENTHPFQRELWGRYWVFAHNGNLVDFHPRLHGAFRPVGDTDSERAFCWLMQELAKAHAGCRPSTSCPAPWPS
jgi:glutamine amidotransferase